MTQKQDASTTTRYFEETAMKEILNYVALKKVPRPQTRGNRRILFAADRQPERKYLVQEAAHEKGRPGKHNETNGRESRDQKRR